MDHYIAFVRNERGSPFLWFSKMDGFEQLDWIGHDVFWVDNVGGPILSLLWGVCGLIEDKKKMDFIIAVALSILWFLPFLIVFALGLSWGANSIVDRLFSQNWENSFLLFPVWGSPVRCKNVLGKRAAWAWRIVMGESQCRELEIVSTDTWNSSSRKALISCVGWRLVVHMY